MDSSTVVSIGPAGSFIFHRIFDNFSDLFSSLRFSTLSLANEIGFREIRFERFERRDGKNEIQIKLGNRNVVIGSGVFSLGTNFYEWKFLYYFVSS